MKSTSQKEQLVIQGEKNLSNIIIGGSLTDVENYIPVGKVIILTDNNVFRLYSSDFPDYPVIRIGTGEGIKDLRTVDYVYEKLMELNADRTYFLPAIGGGLVCDIAGFVASTYMRGIRFGFVSTTLLSQVDASVGGKNGVNFRGIKNLIGVFNQPEFVICDHRLFKTLPEKEFFSGMAEVLKYALIKDACLLKILEQDMEKIRKWDPDMIHEIVLRSVKIKKEIVEKDESEKGLRRLLNFGHTFGHAIENVHDLRHGEAISYGMLIATYISEKEGSLNTFDASRIRSFIMTSGLISKININVIRVREVFMTDKKREGDLIHFVLLRSIGEAFFKPMKIENLEKHLQEWADSFIKI